MSVILLLIGVVVVGYFVLKRRGKLPPALAKEEPKVFPEYFPEPPGAEVIGGLPVYSYGDTFRHKETGEKIEVLVAPEIVNGEYKIRWADGSIGYIHESSFKEFFE